MNIPGKLKEFIEENLPLIDAGNWDKLKELCPAQYKKQLFDVLNEVGVEIKAYPLDPKQWVAVYDIDNLRASTIKVVQLGTVSIPAGKTKSVILQGTEGPTRIIMHNGAIVKYDDYKISTSVYAENNLTLDAIKAKEDRETKAKFAKEKLKVFKELVEKIESFTQNLSYTPGRDRSDLNDAFRYDFYGFISDLPYQPEFHISITRDRRSHQIDLSMIFHEYRAGKYPQAWASIQKRDIDASIDLDRLYKELTEEYMKDLKQNNYES